MSFDIFYLYKIYCFMCVYFICTNGYNAIAMLLFFLFVSHVSFYLKPIHVVCTFSLLHLTAAFLILPVHFPVLNIQVPNSLVLKSILYCLSSFRSFDEPFVSCLGIYSQSGVARLQGIHICNFTKYCQITLQNGSTNLHSHQCARSFVSPHIQSQLSSVHILPIRWCKVKTFLE